MRICLVLPELRPSGGLLVAMGHARRLAESGDFSVDFVVLSQDAEPPAGPARILSVEDASRESYDVAIATWWETVPVLLRIRAATRVVLVQSAEERFYRSEEAFERLGAALALCAPTHFFTVTRWLERLLRELRPDASTWYVPNGIDKSLFKPNGHAPGDGPLRILVEGQHSLWFKGVGEALDALERMTEPHEVTLLSLDPEGAPTADGLRVTGGLSREGMRDEYARHDVLLKLSRVESLGMPVVEAGHMGVPCIVTPFTGHAEVVRHGVNGLVVGFDEPRAVARALDRLATDREMLRSLSQGAIATAGGWPSEEEATGAFATALREVAEAPDPEPGDAAFERWRAAAELARVDLGERTHRETELTGSVSWLEGALDGTREELTARDEEIARMTAERDAAAAQGEKLAAVRGQLEAIERSRTYRVARRLRDALRRLRP